MDQALDAMHPLVLHVLGIKVVGRRLERRVALLLGRRQRKHIATFVDQLQVTHVDRNEQLALLGLALLLGLGDEQQVVEEEQHVGGRGLSGGGVLPAGELALEQDDAVALEELERLGCCGRRNERMNE